MVTNADRVWKRQMYRRLTWPFRNRLWNCYRIGRREGRHYLYFATKFRSVRRKQINYIFTFRIAAGCAQHGVQYSSFMKSLYESNIALNRKMLAFLSLYEPRTFQSLCEFVKKKHSEAVSQGLASAIAPTPSGVITRDMIQKVSKT
ncbi:39S ribosomal protein L20 mitochondrial [Biomphalaria pfeifferi]|uniref:Large ribosomal subunit protein bL20m n=1 Tax=Biomphalaria pfeifferi TaxID=112525 RepID=A0AAD8BKL0_BIOPF|nr:39S ribosomal protein L20 mitochondrial [Biomphalaria pfeifferi]